MYKPLSEHPNPQFMRESYLSLNGEWEYKISKDPTIPQVFDGKILVPFSPEVELSGVHHLLLPDEYLFYKLDFSLEDDFVKEKVYLHFLGVDQSCEVYLNGQKIGQHVGGYLPFSFEIKNKLLKKNTLIVKARDVTDKSYHSRGKQKLKHGGIWYTPQSGIYLPVYIENTPYLHVDDIKLTPDIDKQELIIKVLSGAHDCDITIQGEVKRIVCNQDVHIPIKDMHLWSIDDPYLYPLTVKVGNDIVNSYFAMRKFSIMEVDGIKRFALNNQPLFMKGVLDQGYYKKGYLTPTVYDDYIKDIELVKSLGFNTIRKHIKIEIPRWYYECDKKGIIVWQDFVNGGDKYRLLNISLPLITNIHHKDTHHYRFSRSNKEGRKEAIEEFKQTIDYLYNFPSIALWTIFNEGWGQFDSKKVLKEMQKLDNSRLFDHASGWHDQKIGDIKSMHVYFKKIKLPKREKRCIAVTEFGGLVLPIEGHVMKGNSVYKKFDNENDYLKAYEDMINRDIIENIPKGLSASIYTQLSDVEEETNGFVTFDREVIKIEPAKIKAINDKIHL